MTLIENYNRIMGRIGDAAARSGRAVEDVALVAVTKTFPREDVDAAYELGVRYFGENRVQEAREKFAHPLTEDATLALIGNLQSNKVRHALSVFQAIQTVDRASLITALGDEATRLGITVPVLIQVNIGLESQKSGCHPQELAQLIEAVDAVQALTCEGLFAVAPLVSDPEDARPFFRQLRELRDTLATESRPLPELSMGMSGDFEIAIEEGATQVRIGSRLFGSR